MRNLKIVVLWTVLLATGAVLPFPMSSGSADEKPDGADAGAEFEAELDAVEARHWPRPPLFPEAAPGAAWDYYRQAMDLFSRAESASPEAKAGLAALKEIDDIDSEIPRSVHHLLATLEPAFELVRRGACAKESGRHFSPRNGIVANKEIDAATPFAQTLKQALGVRAYLLARKDPEKAVDSLLGLPRVGADFAKGLGSAHV